MTNPSETLAKLYELAKKWPGGIEKCEWWAKCIRPHGAHEWWKYEGVIAFYVIATHHARDLVTAEAERWLRSHGWNLISPGLVHEREWEHDPQGTGYMSLPEALEYAMGQNKGN